MRVHFSMAAATALPPLTFAELLAMKRLSLFCLLTLTVLSATPAMAQNAQDAGFAETGDQLVQSVPSLTQHWSAQAVLNQSIDEVAWLTADEDVVIVQSVRGVVTVLSAQNGREYWSAQVGVTNDASLPAATSEQLIAITTGPTVHLYQKFTGKRLSSYRLPLQPVASPTLVRREVFGRMARWLFVPLIDGSISAYDIEILERLGSLGQLPDDVDRAEGWRYRVGEEIPFALTAAQDRIILASTVGNVFAADMFGSDAGGTQFQFLMQNPVSAPPALSVRNAAGAEQAADERVVSTTEDGRIFCVDVNSSGHMYWGHSLGVPIDRQMLTLGDELYVIDRGNSLMRLGIEDGEAFQLDRGISAVASQSESRRGQLRAYGASIEVAIEGNPAFAPFRIANRSTRQQIRVLTIDLSSTPCNFMSQEGDPSLADVRALLGTNVETGLTSIEMSPDQKQITLNFTSFDPDEFLYLGIALNQQGRQPWEIEGDVFDGAEVRALVAPRRSATALASGASEAFPPARIIGRMQKISDPWKVDGVSKLLAASDSAIYFEDLFGRIVGVYRDSAEPAFRMDAEEYSHKLFNDRTDRVIVCTSRGRVVSMAERRMQYGLIPVPGITGNLWAVSTVAELAVEFARFHRNPSERPLMPDVPVQDPAPVLE